MKTKPNKRELIDTLKSLIKKYPPEFCTPRNLEGVPTPMTKAYKALLERHSEIMKFSDFVVIYTPGKSAKQVAEQIIKGKNKKQKLPRPKSVSGKERGKKKGTNTKENYRKKSRTLRIKKSPIDRSPQELTQTEMKMSEYDGHVATERFKEFKKIREELKGRNGGPGLNNPLDDTTVNTIKYVAGIAWEIAEQAMPNLWVKLHADLNCNESLPIALAKLLKRRLYSEAYHYVMTIEILRMKQGYLKNTEMSQIADFLHGTAQLWTVMPGRDTPLVRRIYTIFLRELTEYKKKYREDMSQTIMKAIEKHPKSIFRLLEWDKSWIEFDFIHNEISARGYLYRTESDKRFLEGLAGAISKKPAIKKYTEESGLLGAIEILAGRYDLSSNNKLLKSLHTLLLNEGGFNLKAEEGRNPLANFKYFKRYLKRHNVL